MSINHDEGVVHQDSFKRGVISMRCLAGAVVLSLLLSSVGSTSAQDKSKSGSSKSSSSKSEASSGKEGKLRGQVPPNYNKLSLSDEQRQSIYKIQNEYSDKIDDLEKRIEALKAERNDKYLKVLTKAQRDRLIEIRKDKEDK